VDKYPVIKMSFPTFSQLITFCNTSTRCNNVSQIHFLQPPYVSTTFRPPFLLPHVWLQLYVFRLHALPKHAAWWWLCFTRSKHAHSFIT